MATISSASAVYGLSAVGTPTRTNVIGTMTVGIGATQIRYPNANVIYAIRAIFAGSGTVSLDLLTSSTAGTTSWVAGVAQVETNTIVAGSGATTGTMTLVLTSAGMTGSPLNVPVALTTAAHTTAALIAAAARSALEAVAVIAARFTVGGTGADIVLTRKPTSTFTVTEGTLNLYPANDATLNLAIPSGLGVTASLTSTDTTAGVATSGVKLYDGAGLDFEGNALVACASLQAVLYKNNGPAGGTVTVTGGVSSDLIPICSGAAVPFLSDGTTALTIETSITITPSAASDVTINVVGTSA